MRTEVVACIAGISGAFIAGFAAGFTSASRSVPEEKKEPAYDKLGKPIRTPDEVQHGKPIRILSPTRVAFVVSFSGMTGAIAYVGPPGFLRNTAREGIVIGFIGGALATFALYRNCTGALRRRQHTMPVRKVLREKWASFLWSLEMGTMTGCVVSVLSFVGLGILAWSAPDVPSRYPDRFPVTAVHR